MANDVQGHDELPDPELPFLWPNSNQPEDTEEAWLSLAYLSAHVLTGQVCDLTEADVRTWRELVQRNPDATVRLILLLYPACRTRREDLAAFRQLQEKCNGSIQIRVIVSGLYCGTPTTVACCYDDEGRATALAVGPRVSLTDVPPTEGQTNLAFRADPLLAACYQKWFDGRWKAAVPLSHRLIDIPHLVLPQGSPDAAEAWRRYLSVCQREQEMAEMMSPSESTDEADDPTSPTDGKSLSQELGLSQMTELEQQASKLFEKGHLVTIDKTTRLKPLDAPMKPDWFGVKGLHQEGAVSRKVEYRISALDDVTLHTLETKRTKLSPLLAKFSFQLADSARWIPIAAKSLYEKELEHVNVEGTTLLQDTIGKNGVDTFVNSQRERLVNDANRMYGDFHPGGTLAQSVIDSIMDELKDRLRKAVGSKLLPQISYTVVQPTQPSDGEWTSRLGQTYCLLLSIAKYPRNIIQNDRYFFRGLKVDEEQLLSAMNVCSDYILDHRKERSVYKLVEDELALIAYIENSPADNGRKCKALLDLMKGVAKEAIIKELDQLS